MKGDATRSDLAARLRAIKAPSSLSPSDGGAPARRRSSAVDELLADLLAAATPASSPVALVAVGGYGRGELSPHSDIDLLVLLPKRLQNGPDALREILYPLWDAGFQVGHAVATPAEAVERASHDVDAATSMLTARRLAGDDDLFAELLDRRTRWIANNDKKLVRRILEANSARHRTNDRAGWALAPDLKEDLGGLRDVHSIGWLGTAARAAPTRDDVVRASELLLAVREALHAQTKRKIDRLRLDLQQDVAAYLGIAGDAGRDELMSQVHTAARTIEYGTTLLANAIAQQVLGGPRRSGMARRMSAGVRADDGLLHLEHPDPGIPGILRLLAAHCASGYRVSRTSLESIGRYFDRQPLDRWDEDVLDAFVQLLRTPGAESGLELLDHLGGWPVLLPELGAIRGRAQHDPYHRYTVDAHSFLTVSEVTDVLAEDETAAGAASEVGDLDVVYVAALLHDIGKGSGDDHSVTGERLARAATTRMGMRSDAVEDVAAIVRHHLLLADTATRRDLDDGSVIEKTAKAIGTATRLRYLYILTAADGRATGPAAWTEWKATLVRELYRKTLVALETGRIPARSNIVERARQIEAYEPSLAGRVEQVLATLPPSYLDSASVPDMVDEIRLLLQAPRSGEVRLRIDHANEARQAVVTICTRDRPGTLARAAGVLALNQISVLHAQAYSTSNGLALERFIVRAGRGASWTSFEDDLRAAYSGRLAVEAHVERKAREYKPPTPPAPEVRFVEGASEDSTVLEVRAADALGLLYGITSGLTDLDLDIHVAKIDTLGSRVVDVFYVRTLWGSPLDDAQIDEVTRSIEHRVRRLFA